MPFSATLLLEPPEAPHWLFEMTAKSFRWVTTADHASYIINDFAKAHHDALTAK